MRVIVVPRREPHRERTPNIGLLGLKVVGLSDQPTRAFALGDYATKQASLGFRARITFDQGIPQALETLQTKSSTA